jgi:hypothetical protein
MTKNLFRRLVGPLAAVAIFFGLGGDPAFAQSSYGPATIVYPTVSGHCLKVAPQGGGYISDSGSACGAGTTTPGGSTTQLQYNNAGAFGGISGVTTDGTNLSVVGATFGLSGNISAPAWLTSGIRYKNVAGTETDTTSSGTVAAAYTNRWGGNTVAASAATTFTQYVSSYFKNPVAGTNVTLTNKSALGADSVSVNGAAQGTDALAVTGTATLAGGTVVASAPPLNITQTWNNGAIAFDAFKVNVTNTASALITSSLGRWQVNGLDQAYIRRDGLFFSKVALFNTQTAGVGLNYSAVGIISATATLQFVDNMDTPTRLGILSSPSNAVIHLGAPDAASPAPQTLGVQGVVAGTTNTAGQPWTFTDSVGTGTGGSGGYVFKVAPAGTTGSSQNALVTALTIDSTKLATFAGGAQVTGNLGLVSTAQNAANAQGFQLNTGAGSATNPTFVPNRSDLTTGLGGIAGHVALIAGGVDILDASAAGLKATGTIPTVSGTGTPTITTGSTDTAGEVTGGTLATSIVITFAAAKANAPFCVVTSQSAATNFAYTISTSAITVSLAALTGEIVDYHCMQR